MIESVLWTLRTLRLWTLETSSITRFVSYRNPMLTLRYLDQIVGPLVISGALFLAILTNFVVRRT